MAGAGASRFQLNPERPTPQQFRQVRADRAIAFARGDARFLRLGYWTLLAVVLLLVVFFAPKGLAGLVRIRSAADPATTAKEQA